MRQLAFFVVVLVSVSFALAATLGGCDDSCIDTGCVVVDSGPDVKAEAGKKDAGKDAIADAPSDVATDAQSPDAADASEDAADASDAAAE